MNINKLFTIILSRKETMPKGSYISFLLKSGEEKIIQKFGEESVEVIIAAKNKNKKELIWEISDLLFHLCVLMVINNISLKDVYTELARREK